MRHRPRQGIALFSVRIEFWRSTGLNLVAIQPFEPIHNVIDVGARFQIFKNDGDRHAGAAKYPGAAYLSRDAFDRGAL